MDQLEADAPEVLESFQALVATGGVELLGETFHHSLAALADQEEFRAQVELHRRAIRAALRPRGRRSSATPS